MKYIIFLLVITNAVTLWFYVKKHLLIKGKNHVIDELHRINAELRYCEFKQKNMELVDEQVKTTLLTSCIDIALSERRRKKELELHEILARQSLVVSQLAKNQAQYARGMANSQHNGFGLMGISGLGFNK